MVHLCHALESPPCWLHFFRKWLFKAMDRLYPKTVFKTKLVSLKCVSTFLRGNTNSYEIAPAKPPEIKLILTLSKLSQVPLLLSCQMLFTVFLLYCGFLFVFLAPGRGPGWKLALFWWLGVTHVFSGPRICFVVAWGQGGKARRLFPGNWCLKIAGKRTQWSSALSGIFQRRCIIKISTPYTSSPILQ